LPTNWQWLLKAVGFPGFPASEKPGYLLNKYIHIMRHPNEHFIKKFQTPKIRTFADSIKEAEERRKQIYLDSRKKTAKISEEALSKFDQIANYIFENKSSSDEQKGAGGWVPYVTPQGIFYYNLIQNEWMSPFGTVANSLEDLLHAMGEDTVSSGGEERRGTIVPPAPPIPPQLKDIFYFFGPSSTDGTEEAHGNGTPYAKWFAYNKEVVTTFQGLPYTNNNGDVLVAKGRAYEFEYNPSNPQLSSPWHNVVYENCIDAYMWGARSFYFSYPLGQIPQVAYPFNEVVRRSKNFYVSGVDPAYSPARWKGFTSAIRGLISGSLNPIGACAAKTGFTAMTDPCNVMMYFQSTNGYWENRFGNTAAGPAGSTFYPGSLSFWDECFASAGTQQGANNLYYSYVDQFVDEIISIKSGLPSTSGKLSCVFDATTCSATPGTVNLFSTLNSYYTRGNSYELTDWYIAQKLKQAGIDVYCEARPAKIFSLMNSGITSGNIANIPGLCGATGISDWDDHLSMEYWVWYSNPNNPVSFDANFINFRPDSEVPKVVRWVQNTGPLQASKDPYQIRNTISTVETSYTLPYGHPSWLTSPQRYVMSLYTASDVFRKYHDLYTTGSTYKGIAYNYPTGAVVNWYNDFASGLCGHQDLLVTNSFSSLTGYYKASADLSFEGNAIGYGGSSARKFNSQEFNFNPVAYTQNAGSSSGFWTPEAVNFWKTKIKQPSFNKFLEMVQQVSLTGAPPYGNTTGWSGALYPNDYYGTNLIPQVYDTADAVGALEVRSNIAEIGLSLADKNLIVPDLMSNGIFFGNLIYGSNGAFSSVGNFNFNTTTFTNYVNQNVSSFTNNTGYTAYYKNYPEWIQLDEEEHITNYINGDVDPRSATIAGVSCGLAINALNQQLQIAKTISPNSTVYHYSVPTVPAFFLFTPGNACTWVGKSNAVTQAEYDAEKSRLLEQQAYKSSLLRNKSEFIDVASYPIYSDGGTYAGQNPEVISQAVYAGITAAKNGVNRKRLVSSTTTFTIDAGSEFTLVNSPSDPGNGEKISSLSQLAKFPSLVTGNQRHAHYLLRRLSELGVKKINIWYPAKYISNVAATSTTGNWSADKNTYFARKLLNDLFIDTKTAITSDVYTYGLTADASWQAAATRNAALIAAKKKVIKLSRLFKVWSGDNTPLIEDCNQVIGRFSSTVRGMSGYTGALSYNPENWTQIFESTDPTIVSMLAAATSNYLGNLSFYPSWKYTRPYNYAGITLGYLDSSVAPGGSLYSCPTEDGLYRREVSALSTVDAYVGSFMTQYIGEQLSTSYAAIQSRINRGLPVGSANATTQAALAQKMIDVANETKTHIPFQRWGWSSINTCTSPMFNDGNGYLSSNWYTNATSNMLLFNGGTFSIQLQNSLKDQLRSEVYGLVENWTDRLPWYTSGLLPESVPGPNGNPGQYNTNQWIEPATGIIEGSLSHGGTYMLPAYNLGVALVAEALQYQHSDGCFLEGYGYAQQSAPPIFRTIITTSNIGDNRLKNDQLYPFTKNAWKYMLDCILPGNAILNAQDNRNQQLQSYAFNGGPPSTQLAAMGSSDPYALKNMKYLFPTPLNEFQGIRYYNAIRGVTAELTIPNYNFYDGGELVIWRSNRDIPSVVAAGGGTASFAIWAKGCSPKEGHWHRDQGQFSVYHGFNIILMDCGIDYNTDNPLLVNSIQSLQEVTGHNTLQVDARLMDTGAYRPNCPMTMSMLSATGGNVTIDIKDGYFNTNSATRNLSWYKPTGPVESTPMSINVIDNFNKTNGVSSGVELYRYHTGNTIGLNIYGVGTSWSIVWGNASMSINTNRPVTIGQTGFTDFTQLVANYTLSTENPRIHKMLNINAGTTLSAGSTFTMTTGITVGVPYVPDENFNFFAASWSPPVSVTNNADLIVEAYRPTGRISANPTRDEATPGPTAAIDFYTTKSIPAGKRAMIPFFIHAAWEDPYQLQVQGTYIQDVYHPDDACRDLSNNIVTADTNDPRATAGNTAYEGVQSFASPWLDNATSRVKTFWNNWLSGLQSNGGSIDYMLGDIIDGGFWGPVTYFNPNTPRRDTGPGQGYLTHWGYIINDPRAQSNTFGNAAIHGSLYNQLKINQGQTLSDFNSAILTDGFTAGYKLWNLVTSRMTAHYVNDGFYSPIQSKYPNMQVSNWMNTRLVETDQVPDANGHRSLTDNTMGNAIAPFTYGEMGFAGTVYEVKGSDPTALVYNPSAVTKYGYDSNGNTSGWKCFLLDQQTIRASVRNMNTGHKLHIWVPTVGAFSLAGTLIMGGSGTLKRTEYWKEIIRHNAMLCPEIFAYWNSYSTGSDDQTFADLLADINTQTGGKKMLRLPASVHKLSFNAHYLATGATKPNRTNLWRITTNYDTVNTLIVNGTSYDVTTTPGIWLITTSVNITQTNYNAGSKTLTLITA
jgi:hypothetical protein